MTHSSCIVISRDLGGGVPRAAFEDELAERLGASGLRVLITPHLYHLPHGSDIWAHISRVAGPLALVGWLHPRSLDGLIREYAQREVDLTLDLSEFDGVEGAHAAVVEALGPSEGAGEVRELEARISERWYPVIDRTRCTSCRHCLQFCLFGVYVSVDRRVVAARPDNCKDGCPACARVCPAGAIIFPLCDEPAIAGAPGAIMQPDAAARRMYYVRTGRPCRVCGEVATAGEVPEAGSGPACDECGCPLDGESSSEPSAVHQEIDSLIDALDDLAAGGESR